MSWVGNSRKELPGGHTGRLGGQVPFESSFFPFGSTVLEGALGMDDEEAILPHSNCTSLEI